MKLSPILRREWQEKDPHLGSVFIVAVTDRSDFKARLGRITQAKVISEYELANVLVIKATWYELLNKVLPMDIVVFVDEQRKPHEELAVSNLDLSTNKVNFIHANFSTYNGAGVIVSVKEDRPDTTDIDFHGRYLSTNLVSPLFSTHATNMMTIIGGGGNSYYEGKGVAWGSTLSSSNFSTLLPDPDAVYQQYNITVQNHSYGTGIENFYGADAMAYDASVKARPPLMHVFSAGNSGQQVSSVGPYANVAGYANITGSFKMAKNIITVGHTDSFGVVLPASSRGPAYDGRIKPELVAFAEDGSSGAAAIVSGISTVLQQAYKDLHGSIPPSALTKAVLLNSADDVANKGVDYTSGFGAANALKAMQGMVNGNWFSGSIPTGGTDMFNLTIPSNTRQLKVTLVWNDPPASANAAKALINDLDLELGLPATGQFWQPWVLSSFPNVDSLQKLPVRRRDSLNNVEQVTIDNPPGGSYQVKVKGFSVTASSPQEYFVAYQVDTADRFHWLYPTRKDNIFPGRSNVLRWESTFNNLTAALEYSIDGGASWQLIDNAVDLSRNFYKWAPPDGFTTALLRMDFGPGSFVSDTFTISQKINVFVGFNCPDSFMFFWDRAPGVNSYQVYRLGDKYMEPFMATTDTAVILSKQVNSSLYYAVAPIIGTKTGVRSFAFNYSTQGVACYVRSLTALLVNNTAQLDLLLGSIYNVKKITWEKVTLSTVISLQTVSAVSGLHFTYIDNNLTQGLNVYRVRIELNDGRIFYSDLATVYYLFNKTYIVYPNPAPQYQQITLLSNDPDITRLEVLNSIGMKVHEQLLDQLVNELPVGKLSKGLYFLRIIKEGKTQAVLKLVVY